MTTQETRFVSEAGSALFLAAYARAVQDGFGIRNKSVGFPNVSGMVKSATLTKGHEVEPATDTEAQVDIFEYDLYAFLTRFESLILAGYEVDMSTSVNVGDGLKQAHFRKAAQKVDESSENHLEALIEAEQKIAEESQSHFTQEELEEKTMAELREIGDKYEVKDTKKADLIQKILDAQDGKVGEE